MKLIELLLQVVPIHMRGPWINEVPKNLHAVGECSTCISWGETFKLPDGLPPEAVADLEGTHRECENEDCPCLLTPLDYGCVYYKEREPNGKAG